MGPASQNMRSSVNNFIQAQDGARRVALSMMHMPPELQAALLGRRVVFLRGELDDANASTVIGQLLLAAQTPSERPLELYIDSSGGTSSAALAIYDFVRTLGTPVSTTCLGTAVGAAVLVLAGGASGRRFALPHARLHLAYPQLKPPAGSAGDAVGMAEEMARQRDTWQQALAQHTAFSTERLGRDLAAGRWLGAAEARDYGLVDGIIPGVGA